LIVNGILKKFDNMFLAGFIEIGLYTQGKTEEEAILNLRKGLLFDFFKVINKNLNVNELLITNNGVNKILLNVENIDFIKFFNVVNNNNIIKFFPFKEVNFYLYFYKHSNGKITTLIFFDYLDEAIQFETRKGEFLLIESPDFKISKTKEYQVSINFLNENIVILNYILESYVRIKNFKV